jgi:phage protein D
MELVTLSDESVRQRGFYVPQFELRIQGAGLPRDVLRDVTQVTYHDSIKEIDGFEVTVNNWDASQRAFKYVGSETQADLDGSSSNGQRYQLFDPCNKAVELRMGYAGDLRLMLTGSFTTMEPSFSAGAPTLEVRGLNALHQLRRKQYSTTWTDKRDSEIAQNIATLVDNSLGQGKKRFPMPITIDTNARGQEDSLPYVSQKNQYDIDFLLARALRLGYVLCLREGDPSARNAAAQVRNLYFGPSNGKGPSVRDVTFRLKWGASLIDFKPTLTTARQVRSVTVNGWDRTKKSAISVKVSIDDPGMNVNKDMHTLIGTCDPRDELVVDKPVFNQADAKRIAQGILNDRAKEIIKASGSCVGLPDLRAGRYVVIEGLGARFSGSYFITDTHHTINDSGYLTHFNARRESPSLEGLE